MASSIWRCVLQLIVPDCDISKIHPPLDKKLDNDDPEHIQWLYDQASARAKQHQIDGVTWQLTQGVVKRIIPAIASTNAIIAGGTVCWFPIHWILM
jgi:hypothetical protein